MKLEPLVSSVVCLLALQLLTSAMGQTVKVAVIGAGTSGLSAARYITDHWASADCSNVSTVEVVVFEGRDRIGGRIWTRTAAEVGLSSLDAASAAKRAQFDMGASWIHGSSSDHPISKFKDALGLSVVSTGDSGSAWVCENSATDGCPKVSDWKQSETDDLRNQGTAVAEDSDTDISVWASMEGLTSSGSTRDTPMVAQTLASAEFDNGGPWSQTSSWVDGSGDDWASFGGSETEEILTEGYVQLPQALKDGTVHFDRHSDPSKITVTKASSPKALEVRQGKKVTTITHSSSGVQIAGADFTYDADYVIVTVPLGVLQAGSITFSPAIDGAQQNAIDRMGFGNGVKVWVRFSTAFWADVTSDHWLVLGQSQTPGLFTNWLNGKAVMDEPVLLCLVGGAAADTVDDMTDAQMWSEIRQNFVKMFGSSIVPADYVAIYKSSWKNDEFARGIYTFPKVGMLDGDWEVFDKPVGTTGRVYLAGEHTIRKYSATVHGAFLSGRRAGNQVLTHLGCSSPEPSSASRGKSSNWFLSGFVALASLIAGGRRFSR